MNLCKNCNKETKNPSFCSRSCSASYNNTHGKSPKRKPEGECKLCKASISKRVSYCKPCFKETFSAKDMSLQEAIYTKHHKSSAFALIRNRARTVVKYRPQICANCGYSKHVECCHIRPISDFSYNSMLSEINHPDNLLLLCPNCHWEHDHLS